MIRFNITRLIFKKKKIKGKIKTICVLFTKVLRVILTPMTHSVISIKFVRFQMNLNVVRICSKNEICYSFVCLVSIIIIVPEARRRVMQFYRIYSNSSLARTTRNIITRVRDFLLLWEVW